MKRYIGIRNIVTSKTEWKRLLFYEIDSHDDYHLMLVLHFFNKLPISYVTYKTLNGYHFVGLTPIDATSEGLWHDKLQRVVPEYFSGQTLRLSLKENEKQELVAYSLKYPYLTKLADIFVKRFDIPSNELPQFGTPPPYVSVFEKYWTEKI